MGLPLFLNLKEKIMAKKKGKKIISVKEKATPKEPEFKVNRVRMLMSLANAERAYTMGKSYRVPNEISVNTARNWIACGAAEEDKSLDVPKETK